MRGREVTGGSTPKATLFEPTLFRKFVATSSLTESCGKGVASGLTETEKDSNFDLRGPILKPGHDCPHDAHHAAGKSGPGYSRRDSVSASCRVSDGYGHRERSAADRSCDGLGCAAEDVERLVSSAAFS